MTCAGWTRSNTSFYSYDLVHVLLFIQDGPFLIENNRIADSGAEYKGCAGVFGGYIAETSIVHNDISNCSNGCVTIGWGWGANNTMHDNKVNANKITRSNTYLVSVYRHGFLSCCLCHLCTALRHLQFYLSCMPILTLPSLPHPILACAFCNARIPRATHDRSTTVDQYTRYPLSQIAKWPTTTS